MSHSNQPDDEDWDFFPTFESKFLHLPAEIRSMIYGHLICTNMVINLSLQYPEWLSRIKLSVKSKEDPNVRLDLRRKVRNSAALMQTCSAIRREVAAQFYGRNIFNFRYGCSLDCAETFASRLTAFSGALIQKVALLNPGWGESSSQQLARSMSSLAGLRQMEMTKSYLDIIPDTIVHSLSTAPL